MNGARGKQKTKNPDASWVLLKPELFLVFNWHWLVISLQEIL